MLPPNSDWKRRPTATAALLVVALLLGSGCAGRTGPEPVAQTREDAEELKRRLAEMEQRAVMGEVESKRLRAELDRLERELAETLRQTADTAPPAFPEGPISDGIGGMELAPRIESVVLEEPPPAPAVANPSTAIPAGVVTGTAQELYDRGYDLFHQRRYADAARAFGEVLSSHPNHELADNALFWIGESKYAQKDYTGALAAFSDTVERYPEGNKVGDAMLKAGKCLEALGQKPRAIRTYEDLRALFPNSAAALVAEERLRALRP